jgi:protease II
MSLNTTAGGSLRPLAQEFEELMTAGAPADPAYAQERIEWGERTVRIQHTFGHRLHVWIFEGTTLRRTLHDLTAFGVDPASALYFTIDDVGSGAQAFRLTVASMTAPGAGVLWRKTDVGPAAAFLGDDRIVYQTVENALRYPCVRSAKKITGRTDRLVYENTDPRFQVELHAPPRQPNVFVKIANALDQRLGRIHTAADAEAITWLTPANPSHANGSGETLFPIHATAYATNSTLVVGGRRAALNGYATGAIVGDAGTILVTTVLDGCTSLYSYDEATLTATPLFISSAPNDVILHTAASTPAASITSYYAPTEVFEVKDGALVPLFTFPHPLRIAYHSHGFAVAGDETRIPYTLVSARAPHRARGLLVEAYGAYGISSHRSYPLRWLPWIRRGYAVCVAQVRGGRENGDAWYDAARTALRKQTTFADAAAVIRAAQRRTGVPPARTIIYGRSAGGWTAAYVGEHYSDSVGAVYAEVPYLDVLRTTTNPALPLTKLEYDEFGDPRSRPDEFAALQTLSPIDSAPAAPARGAPFLYVKTAAHDVQVLPYEAFKWAARLRELGWDVVVNMDDEGGHFVAEKSMYVQFAQDLLLLEGGIGTSRSRERPHQTRKHRSHAARGITLRRKSSKKH